MDVQNLKDSIDYLDTFLRQDIDINTPIGELRYKVLYNQKEIMEEILISIQEDGK